MAYQEETWRQFVDAYNVDVPEEAVQNELSFLELQLRHGMQYDRLTGGDMHLFPGRELENQQAEMRAAAEFEAKEPRVLKALIAEHGFEVAQEELERAAADVAKRQNTTIEELKRFFGDDLAMLRRDVLEQKAREWACDQVNREQ